jgi:large subunit ribosomal protein L11
MADKATLLIPKTVRLMVPAGKAKPSPAIGQTLGQLGVNMMMFCKDFNSKTADYIEDIPLRVQFTAFPDKTFKFVPLLPQTSWLIKRAAGIERGAHEPGKDVAGAIHVKQLYHIAQIKQKVEPKFKSMTLHEVTKIIAASCNGMGIAIDSSKRGETPLKEAASAKAAAAAPAEKGKGKK